MDGDRIREEWLAKLAAAAEHRRRLFVVARTDARAARYRTTPAPPGG